MAQGVVKAYDPSTGQGVIVRDDGSWREYQLADDALDGSIFRTLRQGQRVVFEVTGEEELATRIRLGVDGAYGIGRLPLAGRAADRCLYTATGTRSEEVVGWSMPTC